MNISIKAQETPQQVFTRKGLLEIINAIPMAIVLADDHRRLTLVNQAGCRFLDRDEKVLIGLAAGEAFKCVHHDEDPKGCGFGIECSECFLNKTLKKTITNQKSYSMIEYKMVLKSSVEKYFRVSTHPVALDGQVFAMLAIEDITDLKQQEQNRIEQEKLSAVLETIGAVCHEMNQPLMALMGYTDLLLYDLKKEDTNRENLTEIKTQTGRLALITRKLSRITQYRTKKYLSDEILDIDAAVSENAFNINN